MPTQAEASIWKGSHGPTPAVSSAEANSEVQPRTNPKPGPKTRPPRISRKNTSSMPAMPGGQPAHDGVDRGEHAEHREHLGVHAALGELRQADHDHDRQQQR